MNKTELAIIEQIALMDESKQLKLLEQAKQLASESSFEGDADSSGWLEDARQLRRALAEKYGIDQMSSVEILREIREEESE